MEKINNIFTYLLVSIDKPLIHYGLVIFIFFAAFLLRFQFFYRGDMYFLLDQARDMMLVKEIVTTHKLTLIGARSGIEGIFHGPLWLYLLVPSFILSKGDPFWTLVPIFLIVSMSIVVAGYLVGRKLYGKNIALLIMSLMAVSQTLIHMTPLTTNAHIMPLIFILYLFTIFMYLRGKNVWVIGTGLSIGLGFQSEAAFGVFLIPGVILAFIIKRKLPSLKIIIFGTLAFLILISNFIFFELRHGFIMTQSVLKLFRGGYKPLSGYENYVHYSVRLSERVEGFLGSFIMPLPVSTRYIQTIVALIVISSILLIIHGLEKKKKYKFTSEFLYLIIFNLLFFGLFTLYPFPMWEHYLFPIVISSSLFLCLSFKMIWRFLYGKLAIISLLVFSFYFTFVSIYSNYFSSHNILESSDGSLVNQKSAVEWIYKNSGKNPFGYLVYAPGGLTYNMDYLMWWVGQKHSTIPQNQKLGVTYLIFAPGTQGAYNFWKKNVIHTEGEVKETKLVPGRIQVQRVAIDPGEQSVDQNYYVNLLFR